VTTQGHVTNNLSLSFHPSFPIINIRSRFRISHHLSLLIAIMNHSEILNLMELADHVRYISCRIEHLDAVLETALENGWSEAASEIKEELSSLGAERWRLNMKIREFTGVPWNEICPFVKAERLAKESRDN